DRSRPDGQRHLAAAPPGRAGRWGRARQPGQRCGRRPIRRRPDPALGDLQGLSAQSPTRSPAQAVRRYRATANGAKTATVPAAHANAWRALPAVGPPSTRARMASTVTLTGWWAANVCSQPGIDFT